MADTPLIKGNQEETIEEILKTEIEKTIQPVKIRRRDKIIIVLIIVFGVINLLLNILSLGPDLY